MQKISDNVIHNVQSLVFIVPKDMNRDSLVKYLRENEIETTIGTYCLSGTTYYKSRYNDVQQNAMYLEDNTITFPCYDGVDIEYIIKKIKKYSLSYINL